VLAWFLGTKVGRWVAGGFATLLIIGAICLRIFFAGKEAQKNKQNVESLDALRERNETEDEIAVLPAADRRRRLSEWVSDDE